MKLTLLLVIINVLVFLYTLNNLEYYIINYGFSVDNFLSGKYYVMLTSLFIHADPLHLLNNMIALFLLGWAVESKVKSWQYLLVYFLGGFAGNLLMFVPILGYTPSTIAVGASAAISALVGLGTFVCPGKLVIFPVIIPVPFVLAGAIYFVLTASQVFLPSEIAYPAHLGGMFVGALFGLMWGEHRVKRAILFILIVMLIILLPYAIQFVMK